MSGLFYPRTLDLLSHLTRAWEQLFGGQMEICISSVFQPGPNPRQRHYSHHWIAERGRVTNHLVTNPQGLSKSKCHFICFIIYTNHSINVSQHVRLWGICFLLYHTLNHLMKNIKNSTNRRNERYKLCEVTNFRGQRLRCPSVVILAGLTGGQWGVMRVVRAGGISQCQSVLITLVPGAAALRSSSPPTSPAVGTNTTTTTTTFTEYFTIENMSQVVFMERGTMAPSSWNFL